MRTRLLLLACLCGAVPAQGQTLGAPPTSTVPPPATATMTAAQPVTLAWSVSDPDPITGLPAVGYIVERADLIAAVSGPATCGPWTTTVDVGNVLTYQFPAESVATTAPSCFSVRSYEENGVQSPDAPIIRWTPPDPRCSFPLGDRAVKIFATGVFGTSGSVGSRAHVDYQLASPNSPIVQLRVLLNGNVVSKKGLLDPTVGSVDLTNDGAQWFQTPTTAGSFLLQVQATNAYGCVGTTSVNAGGQPLTLSVK